jgi:acetate kinase
MAFAAAGLITPVAGALLQEASNVPATLALNIYGYRIAQAVAAMAVALGGLDALVFTAGVGEHSARVRADVCRRLAHVGVAMDTDVNLNVAGDGAIEAPSSAVKVRVVHSRQEVVVARAVRALVDGSTPQR